MPSSSGAQETFHSTRHRPVENIVSEPQPTERLSAPLRGWSFQLEQRRAPVPEQGLEDRHCRARASINNPQTEIPRTGHGRREFWLECIIVIEMKHSLGMIFYTVRFRQLVGRVAGLPCTIGVLRIWLLGGAGPFSILLRLRLGTEVCVH